MSARVRTMARIAGAIAGAWLLAIGLVAPEAAAAGWLIAFATVGAIVIGSVALLLIHTLTGGRWGTAARPALAPAAEATPVVLAFFVLLLVAARPIYPWIAKADTAGPDVASLYLNIGFFAARGVVFLLGLCVLGALAARDGLGRLAAGLGLIWYCVGMDLVAVDWLLSIEPRYTSSAFGAQIIIAQLVGALAWSILASNMSAGDKAWGDLGALLLATILGETYLILMTFIVHWYGDLPEQAAWYLARTEHGWVVLEIAGVLIGSFGPLVALLFTRVRTSASALKLVAGASLVGVTIEMIWLVAPASGGWSGLAGLVAIAAAAGLTVGFGGTLPGACQRKVSHGV